MIPNNTTHLKFSDYDTLYQEQVGAIDLTTYDLFSAGENVFSQIWDASTSIRAGGELDTTPSCECGAWVGNFLIDQTCPRCGTKVKSPLYEGGHVLQPKVWMSYPLEGGRFMHPRLYDILNAWTNFRRTGEGAKSYLDAILNPEFELPEAIREHITGRGFKYVEDNLEYLVDLFASLIKKKTSEQTYQDVKEIMFLFPDKLFVEYLPVMSHMIHSISRDNVGSSQRSYIDNAAPKVVESIYQLAGVRYDQFPRKNPHALIWEAYQNIVEYYGSVLQERISPKKGVARKEVFGRRTHNTLRNVITPIFGDHRADGVTIPWYGAVRTYRLDIINQLTKLYDGDADKAIKTYFFAELNYVEEVYDIMMSLIRGCQYTKPDGTVHKFPGQPVLMNRNPSIHRGAVQMVFVVDIHKDVNNGAMGVSVLNLKRWNADQHKVSLASNG